MEFKAEWTGGYPSLCVGEWKLYCKYKEILEDDSKDNKLWIHLICDPKDYKDLYEAFQKEDWRYASCGGCI